MLIFLFDFSSENNTGASSLGWVDLGFKKSQVVCGAEIHYFDPKTIERYPFKGFIFRTFQGAKYYSFFTT